ncbi:MAG: MGMT family protein [Candidatus Obscuribacterales bacterium]|nr:MGMT family protein [Candidatus Obscuribacterales bacterium]
MTRQTKTKNAKELAPFEQVYEIVNKIPKGKVSTYGQISKLMNGRLSAAAVGWAMNALGADQGNSGYNSQTVPWHRVINSKGGLSTKHESGVDGADGRELSLQQVLLEREGVIFDTKNQVDLAQYLWKGTSE